MWLRAILSLSLPFFATANYALRYALLMLMPSLNIPSPSHLRNVLSAEHEEIIQKIKARLPKDAKVSLALDAWSSTNRKAFLCIMVYFINDNWEMEEIMIGFEHLKGKHTGKEMAAVVRAVLQRFGLEGVSSNRLMGMTTDNASNNRTLSQELNEGLAHLGIDWDHDAMHVPCLAHVIQLILGAFMKSIRVKTRGDASAPNVWKDKLGHKVKGMPAGFYKTVEKVCGYTCFTVFYRVYTLVLR